MNPYNTENIIIIRSVFGKVGNKYYIQPCKDPKTGRYPDCVRRVDSNGDMILSDKDRNGSAPLIPEDRVFIIEDGTMFNLGDEYSKSEWKAIEHCKLIAKSRDEKNKNGVNIIDGEDSSKMKTYKSVSNARYGVAELYIERPGEDTRKRVSKKKILHDAKTFIFEDSEEGLLLKSRLLGRDMRFQPLADVQDFLLETAERNPQRIISLYTGEDMHLRILLMEALQKAVIIHRDGIYTYANNVILGASEDAVLTWMKSPSNSRILDLIRKDANPEAYDITNEAALQVIKAKEASNKSKEK